jgi:membrane protein implicated in regulation of membrane protease activity
MNGRYTTATSQERTENRRRMWSRQVLAKYWAMQVPATVIVLVTALLLEGGFGWPHWIVWAIVAAWTAKDGLLYLFVWPAYDPGYLTAFPYRMEGMTAVAVGRIDRRGTVRIWGELWSAELSQQERQIEEGEKVKVKARHGLTLLVAPDETEVLAQT